MNLELPLDRSIFIPNLLIQFSSSSRPGRALAQGKGPPVPVVQESDLPLSLILRETAVML
jgi:hypothetical protein